MKNVKSNLVNRTFWVTIIVMAIASISLSYLAASKGPSDKTEPGTWPTPIQVPKTQLENIFSIAADKAYEKVIPDIAPAVNHAFRPVYQAIPRYVDFHYSVLGEYTELVGAALGSSSKAIEEKLFAGLHARLSDLGTSLDDSYTAVFRREVAKRLKDELDKYGYKSAFAPVTQTQVDSTLNRVQVTVPMATVAATLTGSGALKVAASTIAKKISAKILAKSAAKGIAKGGGILAGAGTGAAVCSWSGLGAIACGIVGGVTAWFLTDAAVVNIDEYYHRDDFESEIKQLVTEQKNRMIAKFERALLGKTNQVKIDSREGTLEDLSNSGSSK